MLRNLGTSRAHTRRRAVHCRRLTHTVVWSLRFLLSMELEIAINSNHVNYIGYKRSFLQRQSPNDFPKDQCKGIKKKNDEKLNFAKNISLENGPK